MIIIENEEEICLGFCGQCKNYKCEAMQFMEVE